MALKQNDTFDSQYPCRWSGGAGPGLGSASMVTCVNDAGMLLNRYGGEAGIVQYGGVPVGTRGSLAYIQPIKDGGLGCTGGRITGTGTITPPNLAGGKYATAALTGSGSLAVTIPLFGVGKITALSPRVSGSGTITPPNLQGGVYMWPAPLAGIGSVSANIWATGELDAALSGAGNLTASGALGMFLTAALSGSGDVIAADLNGIGELAAILDGSGDLAGAISGVIYASAALSGGGSVAASITGSGVMVAALDGTGSLVANGFMTGNMAALLDGSGSITFANLAGGVYITAALDGSGDITAANLNGLGNLTAVILIGASPSVQDIAQAVLNDIDPSDAISLREALRLLIAVAAGKTIVVPHGGSTATVTFRDLQDSKDRIEASMVQADRVSVVINKT